MKFVSYIRVSTQRQGESGLGLEAQQAAVAQYLRTRQVDLRTTICDDVREFREVESGKNNDRPVLREALAYCKAHGATLVIAKLDRLARSVAFIANLMESDVEFVACDLPQANRLLLHIMAAVAENEGRMISERTKAALAAAKARGTKLGAANPKSRNLTEMDRRRGTAVTAQANVDAARNAYAPIAGVIVEQHAAGKSLRHIAADLNATGHRTVGGKPFNAATIRRIIARGPAAPAS